MTMLRRRRTALAFGVLASLAIAVSCREPTQVTLRVTSGEPCSSLGGVQIVVGPNPAETQARFEQRTPAAVTRDCDASGLIGTLVVAPGGQSATIVVAAAVRLAGNPAPDPTSCVDATNAKSCIIARRSFAFLDHTSLTLPIELDPLCVGKSCDPASTCFRGACVDATVTCNGSECGLPQENPGQGDGGANEAGSSDGAYDAELDAMSFDDVSAPDGGTGITDAMPDALTGGFDGSAPPCGQAGMTYCYPNGTTGVSTVGSCSAPDVRTTNCCRCTCPSSVVVGCDIPATSASSCHPTCPP
jgi:hypothetical protein